MRTWTLVVLVASACSTAVPSPCESVSCSDHGQCAVAAGSAICVCSAGFQAVGLECQALVSGAECQNVTCSGHGRCVVIDASPRTAMCLCDPGHRAAGLSCEAIVAGAECQGVDCSGHGNCVVVDGMPKSPLCVCGTGYELVGTTMCRAKPADPCASVSCGSGTCVTQGNAPRCWCQPGFVESGLRCVAASADAGQVLAVPSTVRVSPSGQFVAFASLLPTDAGPTSFLLGEFVLRDLDGGSDIVIDPTPPVVCGSNGCTVQAGLTFDSTSTKALLTTARATPPADSSPGILFDLATQRKTTSTVLSWLERHMLLSPDLSFAIVGRQTYGGQGGAWSFLRPLDGRLQAVLPTCSDPSANHIDARADGTDVVIAAWTCTSGVPGHTLSVKTMPAGTTVQVVTTPAMAITGTHLRAGFVTYTSQGTTYAVPIAANATPVSIGMGTIVERSPNRRWALFSSGGMTTLIDLDQPTMAGQSLGAVRAQAWAPPATLYFRNAANELWRSQDGAPATLFASNVSPTATLTGVASGVVEVEARAGGQVSCTVARGANVASFPVAGPARATLQKSTGAVPLGEASFWNFGGDGIARGTMYFDVLRGYAPSPDNGYVFSRLP